MTRLLPLVLAALTFASGSARAEAGLTESERHVLRAEAYARSGSDVLAESHYREAVHADPRNVRAYLGLARVLAGTRRADEALEVVRVGLSVDHTSLELAALAATLLVDAGREAEALVPVAHTCASRPSAACYERLAEIAERTGAHPEALTARRRAYVLGLRNAEARAQIALLESLVGTLRSATATSASPPASLGLPDGSRAPSPDCSGTPPTGAR